MSEKILIRLWSIRSPVILVPRKTGVTYTNQTCGTGCRQDEMEGFAIPISDEFDDADYEQGLDFRICQLFPDGSSGLIDLKLAEKIQSILASYPESKWIKINFARLEESYEAWLHVTLHENEEYVTAGLPEGQEAILTWHNSD